MDNQTSEGDFPKFSGDIDWGIGVHMMMSFLAFNEEMN